MIRNCWRTITSFPRAPSERSRANIMPVVVADSGKPSARVLPEATQPKIRSAVKNAVLENFIILLLCHTFPEEPSSGIPSEERRLGNLFCIPLPNPRLISRRLGQGRSAPRLRSGNNNSREKIPPSFGVTPFRKGRMGAGFPPFRLCVKLRRDEARE